MNRFLISTILAFAVAAPAQAGIVILNTELFPGNQVPPVVSSGLGNGRAIIDTDANTYSVELLFLDLESPTLFAHTHCCAGPDANAPVAIGFPGFPVGVTAGTYSQTFDLLDAGTYNASFLALYGDDVMMARNAFVRNSGRWLSYFNIHSEDFPAGEIRGQLVVPAPAALALFGLGVAGLGALRRRA